ncbi:MAG: Undecaprenyl-phosphate 4-deoxy-4-formamido-L-arabinose transferase [Alphaproteobacteria bacterium MarineAlpha6_Bin4]|nr:MAG: Undecaprenyl-phosphate 4-deoxy-4-formamido-L-arabinose transferase [Alphaproteobacteria bacterium MarineAlpha6_Bin3]PPR37850.1 MAG: Undecaprenyl-phosphate 4-deoxy-4-formamido-L-arabinose transferase [Alphaproteobacteria bacterium MarineAlpha6_Bin4]|tara:strand:- start:10876 stop:11607 length:732 start_codon:yes stop_codon:yes gene_type:complete
MKKISIIIPVFNEEKTIIHVLKKIREEKKKNNKISFEVIVVDDCSNDKTNSLLKKNKDLYDKIFLLEKNLGKGAAVIKGLNESTGDYILFQDADLEYDTSDYQKLFEPIIKYSADIVMGSRLKASPLTKCLNFWNLVGNKIITLIFDALFNSTLSDIYSCYLVFKKELLKNKKLKYKGFDGQAEILTYIVPKAKKVYEVPISYHGRSLEEGKKIRFYHIFSVIYVIIKNWFYLKINSISIKKN